MGFAARVRLAPLLLAASVAIGAPRRAFAQAPVEPVRIEVHSRVGCEDEGAFFDRIHARTPAVRRARSDEAARTFRVTLAREGERVVGRLTIEELGHASRVRSVAARACEDVTSALALIAALAIDPQADVTPSPTTVARPAASPSASSPAPTATDAAPSGPVNTTPPTAEARGPDAKPAAGETSEPKPPAVAPPAAPKDPPTQAKDTPPSPQDTAPPPERAAPSPIAPSPAKRGHLDLVVSLDALAIGTAPAPRVGLDLRHTWSGGASAGVRVAAAFGDKSVPAGEARLLWATATLEGCPFRVSLGRSVSFAPCLPLEGGVLDVSGANVVNPSSAVLRPWITVGPALHLDIALGERFFVEARGGVALPLVRDTFYVRPATDVYQAPLPIGWGGIGGGITFP